MSAEHDLQQLEKGLVRLAKLERQMVLAPLGNLPAALSRVGERIDAQQAEIQRLESLVAKSPESGDVRADAEARARCWHRWDFALRDGETWNVCDFCGFGELWAGGQLIGSDSAVESARIERFLLDRATKPVSRGPVSGAGGNT